MAEPYLLTLIKTFEEDKKMTDEVMETPETVEPEAPAKEVAEKEEPKAPAKPRSKSQVKREAETLPQKIEQIADVVVTDAERFAKDLEDKTMHELIRLHDLAIIEEDRAKRELHILRLRASNMATTVEADVEKDLTEAKERVAAAIAWLHAIEKRLLGVPRDIWGEKYGRALQ